MEPLAYIHIAMDYEAADDIDMQQSAASRNLNWWQISSAAALILMIILGGFTRVVASAFPSQASTPQEEQSRTF